MAVCERCWELAGGEYERYVAEVAKHDSHEVAALREKLAAAERERDEARARLTYWYESDGTVTTHAPEAVVEKRKRAARDLAASQAEAAALRAAVAHTLPDGTVNNGVAFALREFAGEQQRATGRWSIRCQRLVDWAIAIENVCAAAPASTDALRALLLQACGATWATAAPSVQMDSEACIAIVARVLAQPDAGQPEGEA